MTMAMSKEGRLSGRRRVISHEKQRIGDREARGKKEGRRELPFQRFEFHTELKTFYVRRGADSVSGIWTGRYGRLY